MAQTITEKNNNNNNNKITKSPFLGHQKQKIKKQMFNQFQRTNLKFDIGITSRPKSTLHNSITSIISSLASLTTDTDYLSLYFYLLKH